MGVFKRMLEAVGYAPAADTTTPTPAPQPVREAAAVQGDRDDAAGWRRLSGDGLASMNERDLEPMAQDRMQKLAEYLWQSNLLANRLVELPLAYLLGPVLGYGLLAIWGLQIIQRGLSSTLFALIWQRRQWTQIRL